MKIRHLCAVWIRDMASVFSHDFGPSWEKNEIWLNIFSTSTGGQTCIWDWALWARICPSQTCREPWTLPWLQGCQALTPGVRVLTCLWSQRSSWYTQVTPVTPRREAVERAQMTSPSQLTDSMSWTSSDNRPCWASTARRVCSYAPSKTSDKLSCTL